MEVHHILTRFQVLSRELVGKIERMGGNDEYPPEENHEPLRLAEFELVAVRYAMRLVKRWLREEANTDGGL